MYQNYKSLQEGEHDDGRYKGGRSFVNFNQSLIDDSFKYNTTIEKFANVEGFKNKKKKKKKKKKKAAVEKAEVEKAAAEKAAVEKIPQKISQPQQQKISQPPQQKISQPQQKIPQQKIPQQKIPPKLLKKPEPQIESVVEETEEETEETEEETEETQEPEIEIVEATRGFCVIL